MKKQEHSPISHCDAQRPFQNCSHVQTLQSAACRVIHKNPLPLNPWLLSLQLVKSSSDHQVNHRVYTFMPNNFQVSQANRRKRFRPTLPTSSSVLPPEFRHFSVRYRRSYPGGQYSRNNGLSIASELSSTQMSLYTCFFSAVFFGFCSVFTCMELRMLYIVPGTSQTHGCMEQFCMYVFNILYHFLLYTSLWSVLYRDATREAKTEKKV